MYSAILIKIVLLFYLTKLSSVSANSGFISTYNNKCMPELSTECLGLDNCFITACNYSNNYFLTKIIIDPNFCSNITFSQSLLNFIPQIPIRAHITPINKNCSTITIGSDCTNLLSCLKLICSYQNIYISPNKIKCLT